MSCQNVCSGSRNVLNTQSSPRSPALGWGTVPGTGHSPTHTVMGTQPRWPALTAVATRPLQVMPEMPCTASL